jgi:hypothetical protein
MPRIAFEPRIPTRDAKVPAGPDWFHEITRDESFSAKVFFPSGAGQTGGA